MTWYACVYLSMKACSCMQARRCILSTQISACMRSQTSVCAPTKSRKCNVKTCDCVHAHVFIYRRSVCVYLRACTCMHVCKGLYEHTCMHACMHAYIHAYIHTYSSTESVSCAQNLSFNSYQYFTYR